MKIGPTSNEAWCAVATGCDLGRLGPQVRLPQQPVRIRAIRVGGRDAGSTEACMRALCFVGVMLCAVPAGAQWLNHRTPGVPRTTDGKVALTAPAPRTVD